MMNTLKQKWGCDSNLIIYSFDRLSKYHEESVDFFTLSKGSVNLSIAHQNIVETERVLTSFYKQDHLEVIRKINEFIDFMSINVIYPNKKTLYIFHMLSKTYKPKALFDTYLAATYISNGILNLYTLNQKDFVFRGYFQTSNPFN